jgi:hypothetical protein
MTTAPATIQESRAPAAGSRLRSDSAPRASTLRWASPSNRLLRDAGHSRRVIDAVSGRWHSRASTRRGTGRRLHGRRVIDAVSGRWHSRAGTLAGEDLSHLNVLRPRAGKRIAADEHPGYQNQRSNKRRASHTSTITPSCELGAIESRKDARREWSGAAANQASQNDALPRRRG